MNTKMRYVLLATVGLPSIALICSSMAQEPQKDFRNRRAPEIPVSAGSVSRARTDTSDVRPPSGGWIQFDKCLVFAGESIEIPSQDSGSIASLLVHENESVNANQVLAKLEGEIARLEKDAAGLQARVALSEAQDTSEIRLAQAFVEETKMQSEQYEEMAAKGNVSPTDFRQRQLTAKQAEVRLIQSNTAKQQRDLKAQLAQSALVLSQQKLDRLILRSPISGTVVRIDHRPGEWIQAGTTVVKIVRLDEVRIDCFIDDEQIERDRLIGKTVKVTSKRGETESLFSGRITSYDQEINAAGQIKVHATVQNHKSGDHWLLLPGMTVSMQLPNHQ